MRIGLIAMSGVRACDPELLRLGLTLPGFVERSRTVASLPSLGLLTLAGMTPTHHQVRYLEVRQLNDVNDLPTDFDLVAISTFSAQAYEAYALADRFQALGIPVVMGGLHVSSLPEEAAEHCRAVVIGEGEWSWLRVLEDAEQGRLQTFYRSACGAFPLANAPMPAFELLELDRYNRLTVQTSRGCPFRCSFCASSILLVDGYQQKPVEKVLAEIDRICDLWPRPFIEFADDNSFVNHRYWKRLLPFLAQRHVKWFTETDISVGDDSELLELMHAAGCVEVLIGLESPVDDGLRGLEMRSDWKRKRLPRYREAVERIQNHGIRVNGCFILGLDGHGPDIFDRVYDYVRDLELYDVQITVPTPFPGTPFYEQLRRDGRLLEDRAWQKCTLFDVNFRPTHMSAEELAAGFRELGVRLYSDEFTQWRRETFRRKYLKRVKSIRESHHETPNLDHAAVLDRRGL